MNTKNNHQEHKILTQKHKTPVDMPNEAVAPHTATCLRRIVSTPWLFPAQVFCQCFSFIFYLESVIGFLDNLDAHGCLLLDHFLMLVHYHQSM